MVWGRIKRIAVVSAFAIIMLLTAFFAASCAGVIDIDTSGMYLVIYNGNGGYLGNKTATVRKLYCYPGSKIPDYPVDYSTNQYTVSSLGLAMRSGYQLMGWYTNADYALDDNAGYIRLEAADGNGVFVNSVDGAYVRKYVADENGNSVFVYFEEGAESEEGEEPTPDTYIFLFADPEADEEHIITVESGFYICNGPEDISEIDDDALRAAYKEAYNTRTYSASQAASVSGWQFFADLADEYKVLFSGLERYSYTFAEALESDEDLDHFDLTDGYASIYDIFISNDNGNFIYSDGNYVKAEGEIDESVQRYSVSDTYVFSGTTTAGMQRYDATMHYWDFAKDVVTEDICTWDGEKYVLNLYAHWEKKNTVYYHYNNGTGQVDEITTKLLSDNITYVNIVPGDTIGKKEIIPGFVGHTFVGWSKSASSYVPWDFDNSVFPNGTTELHLYAYYVDGEYTRITSAAQVSKIGEDPAGKYLIVNDIDLGGEKVSSLFGLSEDTPFTGELFSLGNRIGNFTMELVATKRQLPTDLVGVSPIPRASGAKITGITLDYEILVSDTTSGGIRLPKMFYCSGLVGYADKAKTTSIDNCSVFMTVKSKTPTALESDVAIYNFTISDYAAVDPEGVKITGCTSSVNVDELVGGVVITLNVLAK